MPMWICWINPRTGKHERIYNHYDSGTDAGKKAATIARIALSEKFGIPADEIPGFTVEPAPWLSPNSRRFSCSR